MKFKIHFNLAFITPLFLGVAACTATESGGSALIEVHDSIEKQFPAVKHINGDQLAQLDKGRIILFDVREADEFAVSHLENAVRVDPDIVATEFFEKFGTMAIGKTAVFYCSVGQRSSDLANRVQNALISNGAVAAFNLEGGAFQWHNEDGPLFTGDAQRTKYVHPYDAFWGRMVNNQSHTRYKVTTDS